MLDFAPSQQADATVPTGDASAGMDDAGVADAGDAGAGDGGPAPDAGPACIPAREACNGVDDDCDGAIDEWCECARYVVAGSSGTGLAPDDPTGSIQEAIDSMVAAGDIGKVCVAAMANDGGCMPTSYAESPRMAEDVSVFGGFAASPTAPWDRGDPSCETIIDATSADGVLFGDALTDATVLDGFTVNGMSSPERSAAITVTGGGTISNNLVTGDGGATSWAIALSGCGAPVRIEHNPRIVGAKDGAGEAYGVESSLCRVTIADNGAIVGDAAGAANAVGVACRNGSHCTIEGNASIVGIDVGASGATGYGVKMELSSGGAVIHNREVAGCRGAATSACSGILIANAMTGTLVDANEVEPNRGMWNSGIRVVGTFATVSNNLVIVDGGSGIELGVEPDGAEAMVHSNTVVTHTTAGSNLLVVDAEGPVDPTRRSGIFRNNIAVCLGGPEENSSFAERGTAPPPRILENNDLWGCGAAYLTSSGGVMLGVTGNVSVDPLFVAPPADYRLTMASTLIDSGTGSVPVPSADFEDEMRPQGDAPDIGFDETPWTRMP